MGENIHKRCNRQGISLKNLQTAHAAQHPKNKQPSQKIGRKPKQTFLQRRHTGTSLVAQWLRVRLPTQGTRVQAPVWEDPTCRGATKPVCHHYWACASQLLSPRATVTEAYVPGAHALQREATAMRSLHTATKTSPSLLQLEKAHAQQRRPNAAKDR